MKDFRQLPAPKGNFFLGNALQLNKDLFCIGKGFAMMEATLILATIVQKFKLELLSEPPIVPFPSITLRPKYGIKVLIHSSLYDQTSR